MSKPKLYIDVTGQSGLVVPMETGVVWTTTSGGVNRDEPGLEGIFVPLEFDASRSMVLYNVFQPNYRHTPTSDQFLERVGLKDSESGSLESLEEDDLALGRYKRHLAEAWLPVRVVERPFIRILRPLAGMPAILTWKNSC